jgi:hypothetical protein
MVKSVLYAFALMLVVLLVAVPFADAIEETGNIDSAFALKFLPRGPNDGFVRIIGSFLSVAPLDLGRQGVVATIVNLLEEANVELAAGTPITLTPRTFSRRVTTFETPPGTKPFVRLVVRTCIPEQETCPNPHLGTDAGEYNFRLEAQITLAAPAECVPPAPDSTELTTRFSINDGLHEPVHVTIEDQPWTCTFSGAGGRVNRIDVP